MPLALILIALHACTPADAPLPLPTADAAPAGAPFRLERVGDGEVTAIAATPAGPERLLYTEAKGTLREVGQPQPVGDLSGRLVSGGEMGLLGLAIHPEYPDDTRVFVNYTFKDGKQLKTRISSFRLAPGPGGALDPASEVPLLTFDQPWQNHNAGALAFGPDGTLYIAVGDGGSGGDPKKTGQDRSDLLGSILRIDPTPDPATGAPYRVPPDNPFVNQPGVRPEIWLYGVRNPWGMHFDGADLWFADVGQDQWEEINRGVRGGNYGWNRLEATRCFNAATCDREGVIMPVAEYSHAEGRSVTGGLVYRGPSIPALDKRYVYADFAAGRFWTLDPAAAPLGGPGAIAPVSLGTFQMNPSAFGQDRQGRLYVADFGRGLFRVMP